MLRHPFTATDIHTLTILLVYQYVSECKSAIRRLIALDYAYVVHCIPTLGLQCCFTPGGPGATLRLGASPLLHWMCCMCIALHCSEYRDTPEPTTLYKCSATFFLLYLRPHRVVAGGILFYCRSFFLSFYFFRQRISEMALPTENLYSSDGRI